ncbi:hypothetical protein HPB51_019105 [Rhipicephalus microplus]|uniref:Uncharacterized protein n=1 Tax=Rhipicephalus microplus TaxID=6941 RepID=A0A9J6D6U4_RHIMP|nr:hypothetical protein HPB51_019105 [Rhipicephalus microplus]
MFDGAAVIMDNKDLSSEQFGEEHGWRSAAVKKSSRRMNASATERATACSGNARGNFSATEKAVNMKNKVTKSSRMPRLPSQHWKIIVRPRGRFNVEKAGSARLCRAIAEAARID